MIFMPLDRLGDYRWYPTGGQFYPGWRSEIACHRD
jgi:hypothetical protein